MEAGVQGQVGSRERRPREKLQKGSYPVANCLCDYVIFFLSWFIPINFPDKFSDKFSRKNWDLAEKDDNSFRELSRVLKIAAAAA